MTLARAIEKLGETPTILKSESMPRPWIQQSVGEVGRERGVWWVKEGGEMGGVGVIIFYF